MQTTQRKGVPPVTLTRLAAWVLSVAAVAGCQAAHTGAAGQVGGGSGGVIGDSTRTPGNGVGSGAAANATNIASSVAGGSAGATTAADAPSPQQLVALVTADVAKLGSTQNTTVYASIGHLAGGMAGVQNLDTIRFGLTKALNSLSQQPSIVPLQPVDAAATVYRINLAAYGLSAANWQSLQGNQYAAQNTVQIAGVPVVRGDWLVYAATRPEIYDVIFNFPPLVSMFDAEMGVSQTGPSTYYNVTNSTVVFNDRMLQRSTLPSGGYFWRSYDFAIPSVAQKAFANPTWAAGLGIQDSISNLVAGEFIFSLPNGLQAYFLSGFGTQHRFDVPGPGGQDIDPAVASDVRRPQDGLSPCVGGAPTCGFVINAESCMGCHSNGINPPSKLVGTTATSAAAANLLVEQDNVAFAKAIAAMNFPAVSEEPIEATLAAFRTYNNISDKRQQGSDTGAVGASGF